MLRRGLVVTLVLLLLAGSMDTAFAGGGDDGHYHYSINCPTLGEIASQFGVTVAELATANSWFADANAVICPPTVILIPIGGNTWNTIHNVSAGENLFSLAHLYDTTVSAIALVNGITNPSLIYRNQRLRVPTIVLTMHPHQHTISLGETNASVSEFYGVDLPPVPNWQVGMAITINLPIRQKSHVVAYGETFTTIAQQYRTNVEWLVAVNRLDNPNLIHPGNQLLVPPPPLQ